MLTWAQLLSEKRLSHLKGTKRSPSDLDDIRLEVERDFDRILFSTPVRRLADKTQVFPTEPNDGVRSRLTHSYEASNLARSFGTLLVRRNKWLAVEHHDLVLPKLPSLLAAAALAHDLGNPPFGHQGEAAIKLWFRNHGELFDDVPDTRAEFEQFDGNPQTVRLIATLQGLPDKSGLNLTAATVGALLKYTVPVDKVENDKTKKTAANKKVGYFKSEKEAVELVLAELGLVPGQRHPCAYLVEAADDSAYAVMDVEDAVRKRIVGFHDLIAFLETYECPLTREVAARTKADYWQQKKAYSLSPDQASDYAVQMLRTYALGKLVPEAANVFAAVLPDLLTGKVVPPLLDGDGIQLYRALKKFGIEHVYVHPSIREKETYGAHALSRLLDYFYEAIRDRQKPNRTFFQDYTWQAISENYRKVLESPALAMLPQRYRELRLLCDMVSGMTDSYCMRTYEKLSRMRGENLP
jgi:dGTPase